ncbi:hypothetical protein F511_12814 [Dorcoceras hygrometricum]|uniref:Uncharacterized protein n=1 Tax=Dorcoceras hygrometricum TaxID=472368 RepID=A0A2Z7BL69_9LAMI|nr:hypothetical protein F511_12814 [Dorcoceras hygrometricum]
MTRSARTDSPRRIGRKQFSGEEGGGGGGLREERGRRRVELRDTASRGPTTIVAPESQFRTCPTDHDSIGYPRMSASGESSTTMHRLLHASGSHPIPTPYDPKVFRIATLLATRAWLRPVSYRKWHFTVGGDRYRQSGPRLETGFLRQPALEGLTRSVRTDSPRQIWPETIFRRAAHGGGGVRL